MLLDTSGLMCLYDKRDRRHADAQRVYRATGQRVTHGYVLAEFQALANARGAPRAEALRFVETLLDNPDVEVVWVDEILHRAAVSFLQARLDKTYSLCDAVSFLLMQQRGITDALTTDRHFEQAGFVRLLKS
ncbi:MAG: nucleic acid-binding protein [Candidatus Handelsmanbacteria bacterium RIFCSPLOWO2_12_FULL_64_10]|uniref:Ribonuclease VapC n=1 Tax=Handelsmanbacteria sp. (strain RIFCSPLOWO2_12_FULL_64_10) TaxID=1817868 RepID=A0A1F6CAL6_HANXR|nr:MAG: nucleic acid-binding protein [Candidatus Handelsmanbacteria bacterium RIFCSPLOWO2_12_FULL_64_10]